MSLRSSVSEEAFGRAKGFLTWANRLQMWSLVVPCLALVTSYGLAGTTLPADIEQPSLSGWLAFGVYALLSIIPAIILRSEDPTESHIIAGIFSSILALVAGIVALGIIYAGYGDLFLPLLFLVGPILQVPSILLRVMPLGYILQRKERGVSVGHYGNLDGLPAQIRVTKLRIFMTTSFMVSLLSFMIIMGAFGRGFTSRPFPGWATIGIIGILSLALGFLIGAYQVLRQSTGWREIILDTYENGRFWFCNPKGVPTGLNLKRPNVKVVDDRTVKVEGYLSSIELRITPESALERFVSLLRSGNPR